MKPDKKYIFLYYTYNGIIKVNTNNILRYYKDTKKNPDIYEVKIFTNNFTLLETITI